MSRSQVFVPRRRTLAAHPFSARRAHGSWLLVGLGLTALACGTNNNYYETQYIYPAQGEEDAGAGGSGQEHEPEDAGAPSEPEADAGAPDAGELPSDGLPVVNTTPQALAVDVFGALGNNYYFVVSDDQLERMNERYGGGGFPGPVFGGDIYTPGGGGGGVTFVDRLLVSTPGAAPKTADFGKVQVGLVGESTGRAWTTETLPNFKIDADEFTEGNKIGGVKHMRLNNAIVGSIFREKLTLDLYAKLGYPAPRATYAWVQSSVWGPDISVPYIAVESYKPAFCKQHEADLAGGCVNMWEFAGDLGYGAFAQPETCQFSTCDSTRVTEFENDAIQTPPGPGFKAALADWLDWDSFHRFQCLSWILATGDDALHNSNNLVLVERADGKFQHLPYSIDISLGQEWYPVVSLAGGSLLAQGCQSDPECWDDTIATCEVLVDEFISANPIAMLDQNYAALKQQGMLRDGDDARYESLSTYLARRIEDLPIELEDNRDGPPPAYCEFPLVACGDVCLYPEECQICQPGEPGEPEPDPQPEPDAGVEVDARGVAADVAIPLPDPGEPEEPPQQCLPPIEVYPPPVRPLR